MKRLLAVILLACALSSCSEEQQQVQRTGHGVNLMPSRGETGAGF
jgi:hypothetical protein